MRFPTLRLAAVALVAAGCSTSHSTTAPPTPGVSFTAGNQQTDTIQATLNQALVVRITQANGEAAANVIVQFEGVPDSSGSDWADPVPLTSSQSVPFVADTTNAQGETSVGVQLGVRAGKAKLAVKVPTLGYVDTATFTVTAGAADSLQSGPNDTVVYVNGVVNLHTTVTDRFGNPRTDPVTYRLLSGPAKLSGSTVTVTAVGSVLIGGSAGNRMDTTVIAAVPAGVIAASSDSGGIVMFNLDGSGYKHITAASTAAGTVAWAPNGTSVVFDQTTSGGTSGGTPTLLSATVPAGAVSTLDNSGGATDAWPAYSRDGMWIYYVKITGAADIWRVHPDGTGDALITMLATNPAQFPSPSPDGTQLVYVIPGSAYVEILTLSTGAQVQIPSVLAISTAWSPTSNQIAFSGAGQLVWVVNSDGTGLTQLTTVPYQVQLAWSPDGKWIIARNASTNKIDLISPSIPNVTLPLAFTGTEGSPSWH